MLTQHNLIDRYKGLPVYLTGANLQRRLSNQPGWEDSRTLWVSECVSDVKSRNDGVGHQPITGVIFYRWANDEWALNNKAAILDRIAEEAQKLGNV